MSILIFLQTEDEKGREVGTKTNEQKSTEGVLQRPQTEETIDSVFLCVEAKRKEYRQQ